MSHYVLEQLCQSVSQVLPNGYTTAITGSLLMFMVHHAGDFLPVIAATLTMHCRVMGESNAVRIRQPRLKTATWQAAVQKYREMFGKEEDGTVPATFQVGTLLACKPGP